MAPSIPIRRRALNSLALLLQDQGDLAGARPLFERALAISEKGAPASSILIRRRSLNNLARLLRAEGEFAGARALFERALAIYVTRRSAPSIP